MSPKKKFETELSLQVEQRRATVELIKIISDLWYDKTIELVLFRNQLIDKNVSEILSIVNYAKKFVKKPISIFDAVEIAKIISQLDLPPSQIDIGKLAYEFYIKENDNHLDFIKNEFADADKSIVIQSKDIVLYGFGRIGRLLARELTSRTGKGKQLRLRAIVTRGEITPAVLDKRAALLQNDSVHGVFKGSVQPDYEKNALLINGSTIPIISANNPEDIDYTLYGIHDALVIDNTGAFRTKEALERHLKAKGVEKVLLTAPGKEGVPNIVYGVNHTDYDPDNYDVFSAASCTTNAIAPVLQAIDEVFGIEKGHLETIHAYTNDQNLVDNMHKKYRRGRAAAINMVITETGAGNAVGKAVPSLLGKLTSNAIRVPVPNGSLAILNLKIIKETNKKGVNEIIKESALEGHLVEQIKYAISNELVSSDIIGTSAPAIFDSKATIVDKDGNNIILYVWYDNEYGYSHQVIRLARYIAKVRRFIYH